MANDSEKYIKNLAFGGEYGYATNTPPQYGDRQKQYMANRATLFDAKRAYLASDYFAAKAQGLDGSDFYKWRNVKIRLSDASMINSTSMTGRKTDDFKAVLFPALNIDYFPIGAKLEVAGSTWICVNPSNVSSVKATGIVARCNSSYNSYDHYGNVVTEPIIIERYAMLGNDNETPNNLVLPDGYFNVTCQLNENTRQIKQNYRLILGTQAFFVTGVTDFMQEFSGDRNSCHLLSFTVRKEETISEYSDDLEVNFIANGKNTVYAATLDGTQSLKAGQTAKFTPHFTLNGNEIAATAQYPLTWTYSTSNPNVAAVDGDGNVKGIASGNAEITAVLEENTAIRATLGVSVANTATTPYVAFTGLIPQYVNQYGSVTLTAAYFSGGEETDEPLSWAFSGALETDYMTLLSDDKKAVDIMCLSASDEPLTVTVSRGDLTATVELLLEGY